MSAWVQDLHALAAAGRASVLVTLVETRGSSPRGSGARMIVTADDCLGSVGGGQLEHQCTHCAREMLAAGETSALLQKFVLGTPLDQCCGGTVEVLFEAVTGGVPAWLERLRDAEAKTGSALLATPLSPSAHEKHVIRSDAADAVADLPEAALLAAGDMLRGDAGTRVVDGVLLETVGGPGLHIAVFGAGHVGQALVNILAGLEADIRWIDDREGIFSAVPTSVSAVPAPSPVSEVQAMPPGSFYLVMTHSHALDLGICAAILERGDAAYCGLIGSRTKRRRFEKHFRELGLERASIDKLVCPIGVDGISGKQPPVIAIAAAAEVLQVYERLRTSAGESP